MREKVWDRFIGLFVEVFGLLTAEYPDGLPMTNIVGAGKCLEACRRS
jgi:hypothetical protein